MRSNCLTSTSTLLRSWADLHQPKPSHNDTIRNLNPWAISNLNVSFRNGRLELALVSLLLTYLTSLEREVRSLATNYKVAHHFSTNRIIYWQSIPCRLLQVYPRRDAAPKSSTHPSRRVSPRFVLIWWINTSLRWKRQGTPQMGWEDHRRNSTYLSIEDKSDAVALNYYSS